MAARWPGRAMMIIPFNCAAPFRERLYVRLDCYLCGFCWPSIVPLPFGSGYVRLALAIPSCHTPFNCAAPFRERLS